MEDASDSREVALERLLQKAPDKQLTIRQKGREDKQFKEAATILKALLDVTSAGDSVVQGKRDQIREDFCNHPDINIDDWKSSDADQLLRYAEYLLKKHNEKVAATADRLYNAVP
eukprot:2297068-Amphidinium_carterae.1